MISGFLGFVGTLIYRFHLLIYGVRLPKYSILAYLLIILACLAIIFAYLLNLSAYLWTYFQKTLNVIKKHNVFCRKSACVLQNNHRVFLYFHKKTH